MVCLKNLNVQINPYNLCNKIRKFCTEKLETRQIPRGAEALATPEVECFYHWIVYFQISKQLMEMKRHISQSKISNPVVETLNLSMA